MAKAETREMKQGFGDAFAAAFELGVVARLGSCSQNWCRISAGGYRGWAPKAKLWGVTPQELRD